MAKRHNFNLEEQNYQILWLKFTEQIKSQSEACNIFHTDENRWNEIFFNGKNELLSLFCWVFQENDEELILFFSWRTYSTLLMKNLFYSSHEELILLFSFRWTSGWVTGSSLKFVNEKLFCYVTLSCLRL